MDPYRSANEYRSKSRDNQVLDAVVDYRYFAPGKLALDEAHERMLAEAALDRFLDGSDPSASRPRLTEVIRHRLDGVLILIGTSLQGAHSLRTTVPAASDPESATA
jgi:hypothetical protein